MKAGLAVLALILAACLLAPVYAAHVSGTDPFRTHILATIDTSVGTSPVLAEDPAGLGTLPIGPGWHGAYLLGADTLGRDVAARLLYGGRTSLLLAGAATLLCFTFGVAAGVLAGATTGLLDTIVSGLLDLVWAFPVMLLAITLSLALLGGPVRLGPLVIAEDSLVPPILILGLVYTPYVARPVRAALAGLRTAPFIEAARATGGGPAHILRRHMLPHLAPLLAGLLPLVAAMMLLTEASLSVLGLGVQPPMASWGTLIADGQGLLHQRPLVAALPGIAVAVTVLALNAVAEAVRADR